LPAAAVKAVAPAPRPEARDEAPIDLPPAPPWEDDSPFEQSSTPAQKKTEQPSASLTAAAARSVEPARPFVLHPIAEVNWDGNWPVLAAALPVRGVAQQLAQQSELIQCTLDGQQIEFALLVGMETLLAAGSVDKLTAALSERFSRPVRISTKLGTAQHTANALALADRATRQREAEQAMEDDPFVQKLKREFGATIVPGSIRPV
jgi:DNA polymerase-3 subunit gamma/tau